MTYLDSNVLFCWGGKKIKIIYLKKIKIILLK